MVNSPRGCAASAAFFQRFVAERRPSWDEAEALIKKADGDPRALPAADLLRLAEIYPETTADLAFVQRQFGSNRLAEHLSYIVGEAYRLLYHHGEDRKGGFATWIGTALPAATRAVLPDLAALTFLFLAASLVGFLFTMERPAFGRAFVSQEMEASLRRGNLWTESVFSATPPSLASSVIVTNNISVTFAAFAGGILLGIGTLYIVAFNGLMLGAVFAVCREYGMAEALFGFACGHGFLEIAAILLAAAAGLGLARAILNPGRETRAGALRAAGQRASAVLVLTCGCLVLAGLVEGFISPSPLLPVPFKLALGLLMAGGLAAAVGLLAREAGLSTRGRGDAEARR